MNATDADRKAAAAIAVLPEMRELILAGKADHHAMPFALHRLESVQAMVDAHEALIDHANALADALERCGAWISEIDRTPVMAAENIKDQLNTYARPALANFTTWMLDGGGK